MSLTATPTPLLGYDGTFTVTSPTGSHRTFRIRTERRRPPGRGSDLVGKRIVSLLTGSDNESSYTGFGFVEEALGVLDSGGHRHTRSIPRIVVWKRLAHSANQNAARSRVVYAAPWTRYLPETWDSQYVKLAATLCDLACGDRSDLRARGFTVEEARACRRCGRKLTTPESIAQGLGSECLSKEIGG
jgi:hypothetical protein